MKNIFRVLNKSWILATMKWMFLSFKWIFIFVLLLMTMGAFAAYGYVTALVKDEPIRSYETIRSQMFEDTLTGFVYFNDESVVGQLRTEEDRRLVALMDIPQIMIDAVISIEDQNFYTHFGIDIKALTRAVKQQVFNEEVQTGGSTITQQLTRRVFLNLDRDFGRKAKEILLSLRLERILSKDEILLAYLNKIPYGNGNLGYNLNGIQAAAKGIFDITNLNQINIAQSAYLAGLPQSPSAYSAFTSIPSFNDVGYERAMVRQKLVLKQMLESTKITTEQYEEALRFDIKASMAQPTKKAYTTYPFLMIEAEKQAVDILIKQELPNLDPAIDKELYDEAYQIILKQILNGGYRIHTTIDKTIYDTMKEIAANPDNFVPDDPEKGTEQVGAMMIDNESGAILSMIEGRDFFVEQLNHATQAYRQPGSTMKPIAAYIPALELGLIQPASVIDDIPIIQKDGQKGFHLPENWNGKYHGLMSARTALNKSYNIPAIHLFNDVVGINEAWRFARKMGITSLQKEDDYAQTGVIGGLTKGVTVQELTHAYTTIANKGRYQKSYMISKITDSDGKTIYAHQSESTEAFSEQTAYLMTDMMKTVISQGTATDLMKKFKYYNQIEISGKTGSTQEDADAWFAGYTPDITVGVWIGYDQPIHKLTSKNGQTQHAKNIWAEIMNTAIEKKPELFPQTTFEKPANIVSVTVSKMSGKLPSELTSSPELTVKDIFNRKYIPTSEDDVMIRMNVITYQGKSYISQSNTPVEFTEQKIVVKRQTSIKELLQQIEAVMLQLPENRRKPIKQYIPLDYKVDAPFEVDPRQDDGTAPLPPKNLTIKQSSNQIELTFSPSESTDVIGYRMYRSKGSAPFQLLPELIIKASEQLTLTDEIDLDDTYEYYFVAVDVAGNESEKSNVAYTVIPMILPVLN